MRFFLFCLLFLLFSCVTEEKGKPEVPQKDADTVMILIPEGVFFMGSKSVLEGEERGKEVFVSNFYMDKYQVSNKEYKNFVEQTGHKAPRGWFFTGYNSEIAEYPVVYVDYTGAEAFCSWKGKRLPTEEEWEKGARGTDGREFPWGTVFDPQKANTSLSGVSESQPVTAYENGASPYGLINMSGNVWEWTTTTGQNKKRRIVKGGSWGLSHRFSRTFSRVDYAMNDRINNLGFRCAKGA